MQAFKQSITLILEKHENKKYDSFYESVTWFFEAYFLSTLVINQVDYKLMNRINVLLKDYVINPTENNKKFIESVMSSLKHKIFQALDSMKNITFQEMLSDDRDVNWQNGFFAYFGD